jgi:hypothetical protein
VTVVLLGRPAVATNGAAEATAKAEAATGHPAVAVVAAAEATVPLWATLMATVRVPTASGSASESPARIVGATVFPSHKLSEGKKQVAAGKPSLLTFLCSSTIAYCFGRDKCMITCEETREARESEVKMDDLIDVLFRPYIVSEQASFTMSVTVRVPSEQA